MSASKRILISTMCVTLVFGLVPNMSFAAKAEKKNKRSMMSEDQKKDLRKRARDYCNKKYAKGGAFVESVDIQTTSKVVCSIRG